MARMNEDHEMGSCYNITNIKEKVKDDPSLLEGFSAEEEEEMVAEIMAKRTLKQGGARANNLAVDANREVLKKDPADVGALFELWTVNREKGVWVEDLNARLAQSARMNLTQNNQYITNPTTTPPLNEWTSSFERFQGSVKRWVLSGQSNYSIAVA
ncbi:hypothetical protein FB451DRAFT_1163991 [Mycena latifolia]|nr:hypothetical protein FB451DRAFT_1163991 [Mycena latifolia]